MLIYNEEAAKRAVSYAKKYRSEGNKVTCMAITSGMTQDDFIKYAKNDHYAKAVILNDDDIEEIIL